MSSLAALALTVLLSLASLFPATCVSAATATAAAQRAQPTYFFGAPSNVIDQHSALVVRPSKLLMTLDGHWYLSALGWSGWGSSSAHATGVSNTSNCDPSCAGGAWTRVPVRVTLSSPGPFQGHEIYRCYRIFSSGLPASGQGGCLARAGSVWVLSAPPNRNPPPTTTTTTRSAAPATSTAAQPNEGFLKMPSANIECDYVWSAPGSQGDYLRCGIRSGLNPPEPQPASGCGTDSTYTGNRLLLHPTGNPAGAPCAGDAGPFAPPSIAKTLAYGTTWKGGDEFTCVSAFTGLTCHNKTGHGFLISRANWRTF